jgi:hypothetical protein
MLNAQLIGDELLYRGERVAVLVESGTTATTMGDFIDELIAGTLNEDERPDPCDCAHLPGCPNYRAELAQKFVDQTYKDVLDNLRPFARGGLVRFTDIERILEQLKEEVGKE